MGIHRTVELGHMKGPSNMHRQTARCLDLDQDQDGTRAHKMTVPTVIAGQVKHIRTNVEHRMDGAGQASCFRARQKSAVWQ